MTLPAGDIWDDITLEQTARKMPVDETLMQSIDEDLYYLKAKLATTSGGVFSWKVEGQLSVIRNNLPFRRIDSAYVMKALTLSASGMFQEIAGDSGTLECDVRKYTVTATPIIGIDYQFQGSISSISRAGSTGSTQSITRATTQISTQSISFWKAAINVNSIILLGGSVWRYNLASAPDSDWKVGDYVTFASCTSSGDNGTFKILALNSDGGNNVDVFNASGVAQTSAAGTATLQAMAYVFTNPVSTVFVAGEKASFASHTSSANNGTLAIYAINQGGNNIIVKNQTGVAQATAAGTVDTLRFIYTLSATVSTDIVVGETAYFHGHTSSANDGNLPVRAVSGTQITTYNESGVTQGAAAGSVDSNRWIYALGSDPSTECSAGDKFYASGATDYHNSNIQTVVQVNRSATNNLVVWNESGVAQAGAGGTVTHTRRIVKFSADRSSIYAANKSRIQIADVPESIYLKDEFIVLEVNRGGGSNYNVVIDDSSGLSASQASPAGRVAWESRSVFSTTPKITSTQDMAVDNVAVLDATEKVVAAGSILAAEILQIQLGSPQNIAIHVA